MSYKGYQFTNGGWFATFESSSRDDYYRWRGLMIESGLAFCGLSVDEHGAIVVIDAWRSAKPTDEETAAA